MCILGSSIANPTYETCIIVQVFHANMLLYTNWYAVERTNWLAIGLKVVIEALCTLKGSRWEEFGNAICLMVGNISKS